MCVLCFICTYTNVMKSQVMIYSRGQHLVAMPVSYPTIFWGAGFLMSVVRRKTAVQLGNLGQYCKPSPVGSRGETLEIGYFAFWIAQNIALLAMWQRTLMKVYTRNQHFWVFGGFSLGSQTCSYTGFKIALDMTLNALTAIYGPINFWWTRGYRKNVELWWWRRRSIYFSKQ